MSNATQKIEIPANAKAVVCIVLGDSDQDGQMGLKTLMFADIPDILDRSPGLKPVDFINDNIPEFDSLGEASLPASFDAITSIVKPAIAFIAKLTGFKRK